MGPHWKCYSDEELEVQYSPSKWSTREDAVGTYLDIIGKGSIHVRNTLECHLNIQYGDLSDEKVDIFCPASLPKDAPVFVYIHGGYWQLNCLELNCYMAETFYKAGAATATIGYAKAPSVSLAHITKTIKKGVELVLQWAMDRGSRGVCISGHSAGGQLVAMMLSLNWNKKFNGILKGVVPISAVFDVRPVIRMSVNDALKATEEEAWQYSPLNHVESAALCNKEVEVLVVVGGSDSPEFIRQSKEYTDALLAKGLPARYMELPEIDHFQLVENLEDPHFPLTKTIFRMMGL
ncbi:unnamed protein product [Owenia fusiformis]|uniref:BD-FAE-like domain-containing protein n=1 Tax=Owenia fusiformis TaxID=6347 RepID=A0A8J1U281_OWEFU|nr:unnamed protein product [Owenia fusiformis]